MAVVPAIKAAWQLNSVTISTGRAEEGEIRGAGSWGEKEKVAERVFLHTGPSMLSFYYCKLQRGGEIRRQGGRKKREPLCTCLCEHE